MDLETRLFAQLPAREAEAKRERLDRINATLRRWSSPEPLPVIDNASAVFWITMGFAVAGALAVWVMG